MKVQEFKTVLSGMLLIVALFLTGISSKADSSTDIAISMMNMNNNMNNMRMLADDHKSSLSSCVENVDRSPYRNSPDLKAPVRSVVDFGPLEDKAHWLTIEVCDLSDSCVDLELKLEVQANATLIKKDIGLSQRIYCALTENKKSVDQSYLRVNLIQNGFWSNKLISTFTLPLKTFFAERRLAYTISPKALPNYKMGGVALEFKE